MKRRYALTLNQVFFLTLAGLTVLLGVLFYVLLEGSRRSILQSSDRLRTEVGNRMGERVAAFRNQAEGVVSDLERQLQLGVISVENRAALQSAMYAEVLDHTDLAEVSFTHADANGFDVDGTLLITPENRWQISAFRASSGDMTEQVAIQAVERRGNAFVTEKRDRPTTAPITPAATQSADEHVATDPTDHPTFVVSAMRSNRGSMVWSDLHWSELAPPDAKMEHRVEVTVQKAIRNRDGKFLGVARVGLLARQLDTIVSHDARAIGSTSEDASQLCFLCDATGRLITRIAPTDRIEESGIDLRVAPGALPPVITQALALPALARTDAGAPTGGAVEADGKRYLVTFVPLERTQGWVLGVVAPESFYLQDLIRTRNHLLIAASLVIAVILLGGALTLRAVRGGLARITGCAARMRNFDFSPSPTEAPFRDVRQVMESLEQSKTAMRAMGKYVPIGLVRDLYEMNREPMLGGQTLEVSLMFTDIQGFTDLSERLSPDQLATALGLYLKVMTGAIQNHAGTIDKYIGDSVMAIWNAPHPTPGDAAHACEAALECVRAARELFASPEWHDLPPLVTRFGLHRDRVMVGHFGAPDRMSYTALGDGVNLASRLEGLNKEYGTTLIVSQAIRDAAGDAYAFRLLDLVAVKGKMRAVKVYELLGAGEASARTQAVVDYEAALVAYWARDFHAALSLVEPHSDDPPSRVLVERCHRLIELPPPEEWDGVFASMSK